MKIGFYYSCYDEKNAVDYSISTIRQFYPESDIYLVSEKFDFSYLEKDYKNIKVILGKDTMGIRHKPDIFMNYRLPEYQKSIKTCAFSVLDRLTDFINSGDYDYIVMMDPDAILRGKLNIPTSAKLLGSRVNKGFPHSYKYILSKTPGAIVIDEWGATPGIFEVNSFKKAYKNIIDNPQLFDEICLSFYALYAHDVLLPTIFALIGLEETFNPDIVECVRNPNWESTKHPLVHQFKRYYNDDNWSVIRIKQGI
jgi:hypothetical protein